MVVSVILERNPELEFQDKVDLDKLVKESFNQFQKDQNQFKGIEKQVSIILIPRVHTFHYLLLVYLSGLTQNKNVALIFIFF